MNDEQKELYNAIKQMVAVEIGDVIKVMFFFTVVIIIAVAILTKGECNCAQ